MSVKGKASAWIATLGRISWPLGVGMVIGLMILRLAGLETRWIVFGAVGSLLVLGVLYGGVRRRLFAYTILALSVDAHYYVTRPIQALYTGTTSPGSISIPLALVPGLALLVWEVLLARGGALRFSYARGVSTPLWLVIITTTLAMLLSSMKFIGFCVVWQYLCLLLLFWAVFNAVQENGDVTRATNLLLAALVGQCAVFFLQLATGIKFNAVGHVQEIAEEGLWHTATGTAAISTAGFATFLDPLVMLAFAMFRTSSSPGRRQLYGGVFLVGATTVVLTLNRSSWIALPLGLVVTEMLLRRRGLVNAQGKRRRGMGVAVAALVVIFAVAAPMLQSKRKVKNEEDFWQRVDLMKPAVNMIVRHPVFGVGPGVYGYVLRQYAGGYKGWLYIAHNEYLLFMAERGAVGFIAYLLLLRAMARHAVANTRLRQHEHAAFAAGTMGGLAAHLWEIFWTAGMSFPAYGVLYVMMAVSMGAARLERPPGKVAADGVVGEDGEAIEGALAGPRRATA